MISIENISKSFGGHVLLEEAAFRINSRERVGLVGRNGHGKTTLIRMIAGFETPDSGQVVIPKNYRIGYVRQHIDFSEDTVLKEGMRGLPEQEKDHHWKVEKVLAGLGFTEADMDRDPLEFSGGFQVRLNLAKVLVSEPDLLLLDEPTNYLDIAAIRWVEGFLRNWPREVLLITHDRGFMDQVVTHTVAIHRRKTRKIEGDTGKMYEQIAMDESVYEKTRLNDERRRREIELFISRFRAKARLANLVQSRIKTLEKMEKRDKLSAIQTLDFSFRDKPTKAKQLMTVQGLTFGYDPEKPLFRDLGFTVHPGDRILVVGKNGRGKTTLLKILGGLLKPHAGEIQHTPTAAAGYFEQTNVQSLVDSRTVVEEILHAEKGVDLQTARNICGAMMFEGDDALKKVSVLSGGEKSRVMLGKLLVTPLNLLLLDEPTNHLDMESCDALLAALDNFEGAVIMVTHNETFLHTLANRLIVFQGEAPHVFDGGYRRFLEKEGWLDEAPAAGEPPSAQETPEAPRMTKKELRKLRSEIIAERSRVLKPVEKRMAALENAIDEQEKELARLTAAMQQATESGNGSEIAQLSKSMNACQEAIDAHFDELETLSLEEQEQSARFDARLAELELAE